MAFGFSVYAQWKKRWPSPHFERMEAEDHVRRITVLENPAPPKVIVKQDPRYREPLKQLDHVNRKLNQTLSEHRK